MRQADHHLTNDVLWRIMQICAHPKVAAVLRAVARGTPVDAEFEHAAPDTPGTWQERCSTLYQVIGCLADAAGVFETSNSVSDALDVAAGRGDVEKLLPWPKDDDPVALLYRARHGVALSSGSEREGK